MLYGRARSLSCKVLTVSTWFDRLGASLVLRVSRCHHPLDGGRGAGEEESIRGRRLFRRVTHPFLWRGGASEENGSNTFSSEWGNIPVTQLDIFEWRDGRSCRPPRTFCPPRQRPTAAQYADQIQYCAILDLIEGRCMTPSPSARKKKLLK